MNLGREVFRGAIARVLRLGVGIGATILFARVLGPTSFGGVYLLYTITAFLDRPMMGWGNAAKKRISENDTEISEAFGSVTLFNFGWITVVGCIALLARGQLRRFTGIENAALFLVLIVATSSVVSTLWMVMEGKGRIAASAWSVLANAFSTLSFQLTFLLAGFAATGVLLGRAVGAVLLVPAYVYVIGTSPSLPSSRTLQSFWNFAKYSIPSDLFGRLYDRLDIFLLGVLLSPTVAGYYEAAWKIATPGIVIAEVGASGLMAKVSANDAAGESSKHEVESLISFTSVVAIPLLCGAVVLADMLIPVVYGTEYLPATSLLVGLCVYQVIRSQTLPLIGVISGLDRMRATMWLSAITVSVNALLGVGLTLTIGPIGVVLSTIVAETVRYIGSIFVLQQSIGNVNRLPRPIFVQFGAGALMAVVVWMMKRLFSHTTWWSVMIIVVTGGLVYALLLVTFSERTRDMATQFARNKMI